MRRRRTEASARVEKCKFDCFAKLRTLRKTLFHSEGVPSDALFTNNQLVEIVKPNVASKKVLGDINGVGEARIQKYGAQFLDAFIVQRSQRPETE